MKSFIKKTRNGLVGGGSSKDENDVNKMNGSSTPLSPAASSTTGKSLRVDTGVTESDHQEVRKPTTGISTGTKNSSSRGTVTYNGTGNAPSSSSGGDNDGDRRRRSSGGGVTATMNAASMVDSSNNAAPTPITEATSSSSTMTSPANAGGGLGQAIANLTRGVGGGGGGLRVSTSAEEGGSTTPRDVRSPGPGRTPMNRGYIPTFDENDDDFNMDDGSGGENDANEKDQLLVTRPTTPAPSDDVDAAIPDFITQTDRYGVATTPRSPPTIGTTAATPTRTKGAATTAPPHQATSTDSLFDSLRVMCCCLLLDDDTSKTSTSSSGGLMGGTDQSANAAARYRNCASRTPNSIASTAATSTPLHYQQQSQFIPITINNNNGGLTTPVQLLPPPKYPHKKCLVLDLDETLVHSSFRAVSNADFIIPVQVDDVVHSVYVTKRPHVDEFLFKVSQYYEIVIYTASLTKYADPLLDLLDHVVVANNDNTTAGTTNDNYKVGNGSISNNQFKGNTMEHRLFRESCVYHDGHYVKDLSLLNRPLSSTIIVDNSPNSYIFHPENAIDCSSFIDDVNDDELIQIGDFLCGIHHVDDVRHFCNLWRGWPNIELGETSRSSTSSSGSNGVKQVGIGYARRDSGTGSAGNKNMIMNNDEQEAKSNGNTATAGNPGQ